MLKIKCLPATNYRGWRMKVIASERYCKIGKLRQKSKEYASDCFVDDYADNARACAYDFLVNQNAGALAKYAENLRIFSDDFSDDSWLCVHYGALRELEPLETTA